MVRTAGQAKLSMVRQFRRDAVNLLNAHEIDEAETERSQQSLEGGGARLDKNCRRVEGDDIDY